jgi:hypothetical protein
MDLFPCSGEGKEKPTLLGPLERANINHLSQECSVTPPHMETDTGRLSKTLCFLAIY